MGSQTKSDGGSGSRIPEIAVITIFILGILGWLLALDSIALIVHEWAIYPDVGDAAIGLIIFGPAVLGVSLLFLLASIASSLRAKRLPKWFRVLTVVSPALGCLVGLAIIYRALGG